MQVPIKHLTIYQPHTSLPYASNCWCDHNVWVYLSKKLPQAHACHVPCRAYIATMSWSFHVNCRIFCQTCQN